MRDSGHYGASGDPKNVGPWPNSPPGHPELPGAGRGLYGTLPLPPTAPVPQTAPVKTGGENWGPIQGMSRDSPQTGAGWGLSPK